MIRFNSSWVQVAFSVTLTGTFALSLGEAAFANVGKTEAEGLFGNTLVSVRFQPPGDVAPKSSIGGGTRGDIQFRVPGDRAPVSTIGGGTRGDIQFRVPGDNAPVNTAGGGTRGDVSFQPPGDAAPIETSSGGTRGEDAPQLTALLPTSQVGRTISSHPTFFVYLPPTTSSEVFFSVQDEAGNHLYQEILPVSEDGGVMSVTLPESAPGLEVDKNYVWFFAPLAENGVLRPDNLGVTGWVKRVEAQVATPGEMSPVALATEYAASGIWYDTLQVLVSAKQEDPENATLTQEWHDLLEQVELGRIATQPIAD